MARLNAERQERLEPQRINKAINKIKSLGLEIVSTGHDKIEFMYKGSKIQFFPYSGWHTGKTITDGRGAENLYKQLKETNK